MIQVKTPLNTVSYKCFMTVNIVQDTCFVMLSITWFSVCVVGCVGSIFLPLFQYFSCNLADFINMSIYLVCKDMFLSECSLLLCVGSSLFGSPL